MNPDPIIGRVLFTDGIVRPVFSDDAGHEYVIDRDGHMRWYGAWLAGCEGADAPLVVPARGRRACTKRSLSERTGVAESNW
jgi:hypothetical protein